MAEPLREFTWFTRWIQKRHHRQVTLRIWLWDGVPLTAIAIGHTLTRTILRTAPCRVCVVIGCGELATPPGAHVRRDESGLTVICDASRETFRLVCVGRRWTGRLHNCTLPGEWIPTGSCVKWRIGLSIVPYNTITVQYNTIKHLYRAQWSTVESTLRRGHSPGGQRWLYVSGGEKGRCVLSPVHTADYSRRFWRLSPNSAIVAVSGDCCRRFRRVAEFGDYSRQCGQGFRRRLN